MSVVAIDQFWQWFQENASRFEHVDTDPSALMNELLARLSSVRPDLACEVAKRSLGQYELIISADGVLDNFPIVEQIVQRAPAIDGWQITAFRPREGVDNAITFDGRTFNPAEVWFRSLADGESFSLVIYFEDYRDAKRDVFIQAMYHLLDMALGEYDVTTKIHQIDIQRLPDDPRMTGLVPLTELPETFDAFWEARHGD
ncbi:MAG: hypothetical protein ACYTFO_02495 [Planctomycetota bacterium]